MTNTIAVPVEDLELLRSIFAGFPSGFARNDGLQVVKRLLAAAPAVSQEAVAWGVKVIYKAIPERAQWEYIDSDRDLANQHLNEMLLLDEDKIILSTNLVPLYTAAPTMPVAETRDEIIEECAKVLKDSLQNGNEPLIYELIVKLRALKKSPEGKI